MDLYDASPQNSLYKIQYKKICRIPENAGADPGANLRNILMEASRIHDAGTGSHSAVKASIPQNKCPPYAIFYDARTDGFCYTKNKCGLRKQGGLRFGFFTEVKKPEKERETSHPAENVPGAVIWYGWRKVWVK